MVSSSGGGFGRPHDRPPERVLDDVANGMLSADAARQVYGVVLADGAVVAAATEEARAAEATPCDAMAVTHGPARAAYEAVLPGPVSALVAEAVLAAPAGRRRFLHADLKRALREGRLSPDAAAIARAVSDLSA
jgi:N-methylhydantoinase B